MKATKRSNHLDSSVLLGLISFHQSLNIYV